MSISSSDILNIENYYKIEIPESYRVMLILIGEKLINIAIERSLYNKFSSVYDIQDMMLKGIKCIDDHDISTLLNPCNIFFLTPHSRKDAVTDIAYFIDANGQNDSHVYAWETDIAYEDYNKIVKFANGIEEWLLKTNSPLHLELQAKKAQQ
jgi:hypothetical protein